MELFLIAHKVRGKQAFDIAEKMVCFKCQGPERACEPEECDSCGGVGYWWIVSTFGHRAYPYWHHSLGELFSAPDRGTLCVREMIGSDDPPEGIRDFYIIHQRQVAATKARAKPAPNDNLTLEDLGL